MEKRVFQHVVTNIEDISPRQLCTIYILLQVTERLPLFSCSETPTASFSEILLGIFSLKLRQIFAGEHIQSNHEIKLLSVPGLQPTQTGGGLLCGVEFGARMADLAYR